MARSVVVPLPGKRRAVAPWALGGAALLIIILAILALTGALAQARDLIPGLRQSAPAYQTATVQRGNIEVSVTATGPIEAVNSLPLTFKTSGKLAELDVQPGDRVKKGQVLAKLDTTDLQTALEQAKANLAQAQANLAKVQAGATAEQRNAAKVAVDNARTAAANAQANVATAKANAAQSIAAAQGNVRTAQLNVQAAQDALQAAQDQQARGLAADQVAVQNAEKNLEAAKAAAAADLPIQQQNLEKAKDSLWSAQINRDAICGRSKGPDCQAANANVAAAETAVTQAAAQVAQSQQQDQQQIAQAQAQLDQARAQLENDKAKLAAAVTSAQNQLKQAQAALANAQTSVAQAQAQATATVQNAQAQADQAAGALKAAEASYQQTVAPPDPADIAAAKAQVINAQAAVDQAQANLDAAVLTAPFDGVVAEVNGTVGQQVSGGPVGGSSSSSSTSSSSTGALITLVDLTNLRVTTQVNEADIAKVKVGDPVTFSVSAFPDKVFTGKVLSIQPVGTVVQNVVNYNVVCSIQSTPDATLYPGMTAAATIIADRRNGVLVVPNTALSFAQTAIRDRLVSFAGFGGARQTGGGETPAARQQTGQRAQARPTGSAGTTGSGGGFFRSGGQTGAVGQESAANRGIVLTLKDGQLVPVRVTMGITDGTRTEILSGLNEGDTVVIGATGAAASRTTGQTRPGGPGGPGGGPVVVGGFGR
jgi:HlyD family secretion protein